MQGDDIPDDYPMPPTLGEQFDAAMERVAALCTLLDAIDTTLQLYGHVDANTDLHKRIQTALAAQ